MDKEQIIQWAREAAKNHPDYKGDEELAALPDAMVVFLEAFANLVAAHEREACAMVCETHAPTTTPTWVSYAAAIRARGNHA